MCRTVQVSFPLYILNICEIHFRPPSPPEALLFGDITTVAWLSLRTRSSVGRCDCSDLLSGQDRIVMRPCTRSVILEKLLYLSMTATWVHVGGNNLTYPYIYLRTTIPYQRLRSTKQSFCFGFITDTWEPTAADWAPRSYSKCWSDGHSRSLTRWICLAIFFPLVWNPSHFSMEPDLLRDFHLLHAGRPAVRSAVKSS